MSKNFDFNLVNYNFSTINFEPILIKDRITNYELLCAL